MLKMLKTPSHNLCLPSNGDIYAILLFLSQSCQAVRRSAPSVCRVGVVMANNTVGVVAPPAATLPSLHPCCRLSYSQFAASAPSFLSATAAACCWPSSLLLLLPIPRSRLLVICCPAATCRQSAVPQHSVVAAVVLLLVSVRLALPQLDLANAAATGMILGIYLCDKWR